MSVLYDEMMDSLEEIQEHISESNYDGSSFDENSYGSPGERMTSYSLLRMASSEPR